MIIIGIDPGTAITGWGVIKTKKPKALEVLDYGAITTEAKKPAGERLAKLYFELNKIISKFKPDVMAVEQLFFFKNLKTALPVSEARGVILLAASQKKLKVQQFTPLQVKMALCGYGRADKKQIQKMVQQVLGLKHLPKPDDAADGLALALCVSFTPFTKVSGGLAK
ncbi:MAG: crossover junction endodeoxyribonuclease RuvC [Patescibacteria group bacterium]|nr:crossover junction endodeoxyribonuclease RuvC [Patescibacteria group bacterium]